MTARQRPASGSAAAPPAAPPANGVSNGAAATFHWETWFAGASADQRAEALALARQQGLLYLHQLSAAPHQRTSPAAKTLAPLLARLLAGKADGLPHLDNEPITFADSHLDPLQREAVRRALNTPDVFLLQGLPGTGKSRVVAEVIVQAARRGWRVLLTAPTAPAVDVVLERLAGCSDVLPIRLLAADERAEALPRGVQTMTLPEQRRIFRERTLAGARQARTQAEETCTRRQREEAVWPKLPPLGEQIIALDEQVHALDERARRVDADVEGEAVAGPAGGQGAFAQALARLAERTGQSLGESASAQKGLEEQQAAARKERDEIAAKLAALEPRCRAREERRWWTAAFWTGKSALRDREALTGRRELVDAGLTKLTESVAAHAVARQQIEAKNQSERRDLIRNEIERRRHDLTSEAAALRAKLAQRQRDWQAVVGTLTPAELQPAGFRQAEIDAARQRWQHQRECDDASCQFARQWADYLDQAGEQLVPRLPALANLVAGTIPAVSQNGDCTDAVAAFDLLIIEEAEHLTEADLLRLAAHAPRLMLVSHVWREAAATAPPTVKGTRSLHGLPPAAVCWPRLAHTLADDLARLPYSWHREGDRLVCHLCTVRPDETRYLEREVLADAPEIELHILNRPRAKPVLARVSFPGQRTIPDATRFIYRELQELPIQPLGRTAWWDETRGAWVLHLGPAAGAPTETVQLDGDVRMELIADGQPYAGRGARLEFGRPSFADRGAAERWVETNLHWRDRERSVYLQVPYRMYRPLAEVVGPLLFPDVCLASLLAARASAEALFEFVPVPLPRRADWPREGAGLEQDLATGRQGDRLPTELRGELPRKGIVNYLEAQALVRRLEQWAQAPTEIAANGKAAPSVLVLALYEAQAELLRRLAARSPVLKARPFPLEIGVPGQVRQRECDVLVLSLTRSHAHRCVPFGEDAADLTLALTRSRRRILVFGDLGTLMKRTQWQGALDHLDAPDAHVEGLRVGRLLRHLQSLPNLLGAATVATR